VAGQQEGEPGQRTLDEALAAARTIEDADDRSRALASLAGQQEGEPRQRTLDEALAVARTLEHNDYVRSQALRAVAEQLASLAGQQEGGQRQRTLDEALAAARTLEHADDRSRALAAVASAASRYLVDGWKFLQIWLRDRLTRPQWLAGLKNALPAIRAQGGESTILGCIHAISVASRQWP
jgi:hypothetical protein